MTSPWSFSTWGIDIIGKVTLKALNGHEFILVAINYFTKWVEAESYAVLNAKKVSKFIKKNIICRYAIPHELVSDNGLHFEVEVTEVVNDTGFKDTNLLPTDLRPMVQSKPPTRTSKPSSTR